MSAARRRPAALVLAVLVAVALLAGCGSPSPGGPRIVVAELGASVIDAVTIVVRGLRPAESVVLTATARTSSGVWRSRAVYAVPPDGVVDLSAQRPTLAGYAGPDASGPLWSMTGPPVSQGELERAWAYGGVDVTLAAEQDGRRVAVTTLHRRGLAERTAQRFVEADELVPQGVPPDATTVPPGGAAGWIVVPLPPKPGPRPGVLIIDGDEGGASAVFAARVIAAAGFPVFVLPAFGPEGRLPGSAALATETFDAALRWFAERRLVQGDRILVYGTGAAAGLALWFAANRSEAVRGAVAAAGPTALLCAAPGGSSSLTEHGLPVPCVEPGRGVPGTTLPPLQRIPGPLLLACGAADETLPASCSWTLAALGFRGPRPGDTVLVAPDAAHDIVTAPMLPIGLEGLDPVAAQATEQARRSFWTALADTLIAELRR